MMKLINKNKDFYLGVNCREFITASRFYGFNKKCGRFVLKSKDVTVVRFAHTNGLKDNQQVDITPILVYENADLLKLQAVLENKRKSGVYR